MYLIFYLILFNIFSFFFQSLNHGMVLAILMSKRIIFHDIYSDNNITVDREIWLHLEIWNLHFGVSYSQNEEDHFPRIDISKVFYGFSDSY